MWSLDLDPIVFGLLRLPDLLAARATSRAWRRRLGAGRRAVWAAVRPHDYSLINTLAGPLPAARLAAAAYAVGPTFIQSEKNYILVNACADGHIATAIWLMAKFELPHGPIKANHNFILSRLCYYGKLDAAVWLADEFGLTHENARTDNNSAFVGACWQGRLPVAQWLAARFEITRSEARAYCNRALKWAIDDNRLTTVQWLVAHFKLSAHDAQEAFGDPSQCNTTQDWIRRHFSLEI